MKKDVKSHPLSGPSLSIVIAVKDDETEIGETLNTLLQLDYRPLEIVVVVDRSTDRTESIVAAAAARDDRLKMVVVKELPAGWLGKVNAMNRGVQQTTGDYFLFMDADMGVDTAGLTRALEICHEQQLDHLAVLPQVCRKGFLHDIMMVTSTILFISSSRPWMKIEDRPLKSVKGMGKFNLVKRSKFEKTEGFEWLKMDVADDVALAQLIAKNGGRSLLLNSGVEGLTLDWYQSFWGVVTGLEKNIVSGFTNYNPLQILFMPLMSSTPLLVPLWGLLHGPGTVPFMMGQLCFIMTLLFAVGLRRQLHYPVSCIFFFPLGLLLLGFILLRASYLCFRNKGIIWSGTHYPMEELRKGSRVKMGL